MKEYHYEEEMNRGKIIEVGLLELFKELNDEETLISNNEETMNTHNLRTFACWGLVFVIAGLSAVKGSVPADLTMLISVLGMLEHILAGDTASV